MGPANNKGSANTGRASPFQSSASGPAWLDSAFDVKSRSQRFAVVACVLVALVAGLVWRLTIAPGRMVAAIQRGDLQKIDRFTHLGIHPDSDAFLIGGLMHCAAASGQTQSMARLQELGGSVNRLDGYGVTPVHVAVRFHQIGSLGWLVAHGADPSIRDRSGRTAFDYVSSEVPEQQRDEFIATINQTSNQHLQPTPR